MQDLSHHEALRAYIIESLVTYALLIACQALTLAPCLGQHQPLLLQESRPAIEAVEAESSGKRRGGRGGAKRQRFLRLTDAIRGIFNDVATAKNSRSLVSKDILQTITQKALALEAAIEALRGRQNDTAKEGELEAIGIEIEALKLTMHGLANTLAPMVKGCRPPKPQKTTRPRAKIKHKKSLKETLWEKFQGTCFYCGETLAYTEATLDHVVPRSKKGTNKAANLALSCKPCNTKKGNRMPTQEELEKLAQFQ